MRQTECSPHKRLNYIESGVGLFHMHIAVLVMLYRIHGGNVKEFGSLSYWMKVLDRNRHTLWDGHKELVKDFRKCQELFDNVLDGYILGLIAHLCGCESTDDLINILGGRNDIGRIIEGISDRLIDFNRVNGQRTSSKRDRKHENLTLFIQHGLVLRNFIHAMKYGDIGRVLVSLRYFTVWFQASKQYNYANETIHLGACLKVIWSPGLRRFVLQNMLVNLTGKKDGFYACDQLNEHVVREIKAMMMHNVTPTTDEYLRKTLSPQILFFLNIKEKMAEECDTTPFDTHHQEVNPFKDILKIVRNCLREHVYTSDYDRGDEEEAQVLDLFISGQQKLSNTRRLSEYKTKISQMGFRGIVEMRMNVEDLDERTDENEVNDDEFDVEGEDMILGAFGEDEDWLLS